jgi:hypothetical protein
MARFQDPPYCFQMSVARRRTSLPALGAFLPGLNVSSPISTTESAPSSSLRRRSAPYAEANQRGKYDENDGQ